MALGQDIAMALRRGDVVTLAGDLGAGKSTLARAALRALAANPKLEVPSPTYTLCQRYDLLFPVFHFDFYRLSSEAELEELGFDEACQNGAVFVEWPQIAAGRIARQALQVELSHGASAGRVANISAGGNAPDSLAARFGRSCKIRRFLETNLGIGTERRFLQGDASSRRYETAHRRGKTRILMDAPRQPDGPPVRDAKPYSRIAHLAEDVVPFIAIAQTLHDAGLAAPAIHAASTSEGLLLIEHLGKGRLAGTQGKAVQARYLEAVRLLAMMHQRQWPRRVAVAEVFGKNMLHKVPVYDRDALMIEASLMADWYVPHVSSKPLGSIERAQFEKIWEALIAQIDGSMPTLVMRDFHSPNLIWRPRRKFPLNLGLIDFQDAVIGPQAYDLASLAQDARVDISRSMEKAIVEHYLSLCRAKASFDETAFRRDYAILAAHRATKILGIFVRLNQRDNKPGYLKHLLRMRDYLERNLRHPALADYREWCKRVAGFDRT